MPEEGSEGATPMTMKEEERSMQQQGRSRRGLGLEEEEEEFEEEPADIRNNMEGTLGAQQL